MITVIEHHIQRDIIDRLMHNQRLRFSELKPAGMESNIFMYHIAQLKKLHYIDKDDEGYFLIHDGLQYVDGLRRDSIRPHRQPKVIAIVVLRNDQGQWLMAERITQPYIHQRMFMSGQQHFGESLYDQPARELAEIGIQDVTTTYRGIADIQITTSAGVLTQVVAHVHSSIYNGPPPQDNDRFHYVWHDFALDNEVLMPGTNELYEQLQDAEPFVCSITTPLI
jgi:hypothetical protein